jgi:hypothetical protein
MRYALSLLLFLALCCLTAAPASAADIVYLDCQVFFASLDTENENGLTEQIPITINYVNKTVNDEAAVFTDRLIQSKMGEFDIVIDRYTGNINFRTNARRVRGSGVCRIVTERKF